MIWPHCVLVIDLVSPKREQAEQGRQWRQGDQKVKVKSFSHVAPVSRLNSAYSAAQIASLSQLICSY